MMEWFRVTSSDYRLNKRLSSCEDVHVDSPQVSIILQDTSQIPMQAFICTSPSIGFDMMYAWCVRDVCVYIKLRQALFEFSHYNKRLLSLWKRSVNVTEIASLTSLYVMLFLRRWRMFFFYSGRKSLPPCGVPVARARVNQWLVTNTRWDGSGHTHAHMFSCTRTSTNARAEPRTHTHAHLGPTIHQPHGHRNAASLLVSLSTSVVVMVTLYLRALAGFDRIRK